MTKPAAVRIPGSFSRVPFYYGWVTVGLAALAMVGTLPGRTQGLGLITELLERRGSRGTRSRIQFSALSATSC